MAREPATASKPRIRRTRKDLFLDELRKRAGSEQKLVTNDVMREGLGWDPAIYKLIKEELVAEKTIIVGPGRSGLVGLANAPGTTKIEALRIFISYSHKDEKIKNDFVSHLSPLKRLNLVSEWHDRKIEPGDKWEQSISTNLSTADIIVLLISIDFINSNYCYDIEMEAALERVANGSAILVPVIVRSCMWKTTKFAAFQALPTDGRAITTWSDHDEAFTNVAEGIQQVAERIISRRESL